MAACHSGDPGTVKATAVGPPLTVPRWASIGCTGGTLTTGQHVFQGRGFIVKVPDRRQQNPQDPQDPVDAQGIAPAPLILDLHGLNSSGLEQAIYGRLADKGAERGFVVVEPDSAPERDGWALPGMRDGDADITYVSALLDHLEKGLCLDRRREFAAGFSNGAGLATALVCGLGGRLAGVAAVSGLNLARPCTRPAPTTIVAFHGTSDPVVPYRGGEPFGGDRSRIPSWMVPADGAFDLPSVSSSAAAWGRVLGCDRTASTEAASGVRRHSWTSCRRDARVDLYTVTGAGHAWPGSAAVGAGTSTKKIDATAVTLDAFAGDAPRWRGHGGFPPPPDLTVQGGVGGSGAPSATGAPGGSGGSDGSGVSGGSGGSGGDGRPDEGVTGAGEPESPAASPGATP